MSMAAQERMTRMYDRALVSKDYQHYFEDSGFYNFGYWDGRAATQREASEALIDELTGRIEKKGGRILDVACGPGATTRHLMQSYAPADITAINISEAQLAAASKRAPGCTFLRMDATRLAFPDEHFDAVMCVEAAFHFNTRGTFFKRGAAGPETRRIAGADRYAVPRLHEANRGFRPGAARKLCAGHRKLPRGIRGGRLRRR